ncbi:MAG: hypothetical protein NTW81_06310 [Actinobacteria bacterium]|nr:hypothetical protein [Actinomycetota bacterium]
MSDVKQWMTTAVCKGCNAVGTIRPILYGYPTDEMASNENIVLGGCCVSSNDPDYACGGCCVTDNDPDYACTACHWECNRNSKTGELIGFPFEQ